MKARKAIGGTYSIEWNNKNYISALLRYQRDGTIIWLSTSWWTNTLELIIDSSDTKFETEKLNAEITPFQISELVNIVNCLSNHCLFKGKLHRNSLGLKIDYEAYNFSQSLQNAFPPIPYDLPNDINQVIDNQFVENVKRYINKEERNGKKGKSAKSFLMKNSLLLASVTELLESIQNNGANGVLGAVVLRDIKVVVFNTSNFCYRLNYGETSSIKRMPNFNIDIDTGFYCYENIIELADTLILNKFNSIFSKWVKNNYMGEIFHKNYSLMSEKILSKITSSIFRDHQKFPTTRLIYNDESFRQIPPEKAITQYKHYLSEKDKIRLPKELSFFSIAAKPNSGELENKLKESQEYSDKKLTSS